MHYLPEQTINCLSSKRYYDAARALTVVKLFSGDCYVAHGPGEMLTTVLGSCISACIRDERTGLGGMNHFLLPGIEHSQGEAPVLEHTLSAATRYGAFAMEQLINMLLSLGADKRRLEVKIFGGANVVANSARIGDRNVKFIRNFLHREGIPITSEHLGGASPRRIHYFPDSGKVLLRLLPAQEDAEVFEVEKAYQQRLTTQPAYGDAELF